MRNLTATLLDYDLHLLHIIANRWDVDLETHETRQAVDTLTEAMLDPEQAAHEWERLSDQERGALQMVLGANAQHRMPEAQFTRLFKDIRRMGEARREREKPHLEPLGIAETLYYRGLISIAFDQGKAGMQAYVYVPQDLAAVLPSHQTGYDLSAEADEEFPPEESPMPEMMVAAEPEFTRRADTMLVDDMTTVLAYLRIHEVHLEGGYPDPTAEQALLRTLLGPANLARLDLILRLAYGLGLIAEVDRRLNTAPVARRWLEKPRTEQVKILVEAWQGSNLYNELFHVPELQPEGTGWQNDPRLARQALQAILAVLPDEEWLSIADLIAEIRATEPDFQRPGGDYDSWYIRDRASGNYLRGFESWDAVEGRLLYFLMTGPMHWLGLLDVGGPEEDLAQPAYCRLNVFGQAWAGQTEWPLRPDPDTPPLHLSEDGKFIVPRGASRYNRFQLARFTAWADPADPYIYQLTAQSVRQAAEQGIKLEHIQSFIQRTTSQPMPPSLQKQVEQWQTTASTSVTLERLAVLRVDDEATLNQLWETPPIRQFFGQRLGPRAAVVRAERWNELVRALEEQGISVDT